MDGRVCARIVRNACTNAQFHAIASLAMAASLLLAGYYTSSFSGTSPNSWFEPLNRSDDSSRSSFVALSVQARPSLGRTGVSSLQRVEQHIPVIVSGGMVKKCTAC